MAFSIKIKLGEYTKSDGTCAVHLQAIIDGKRALVPLGFYLRSDAFDKRRQRMKASHPNSMDFDEEIELAITKANSIASRYRRDGILLTPEAFRKEYTNPTEAMDLIKFMKHELELKSPTISHNTVKNHNTVINKLSEMSKVILFSEVNRDLVQKFRNKLVRDGNGPATMEKVIKILKQYLSQARKNGIAVKDIEIKIKTFRSNRSALTEEEVDAIDKYYRSADCPRNFKKALRYFLFSCYTGVRISDIKVLTWKNISGNVLTFIPVKTKSKNEKINIPLLDIDKQYLPEYTSDNELIFDTYTDQVNNRLLKKIASKCGIKKNVTYHTSRHTFGSFMAEGGDVVSLQKMMGHSNIKTSMEYVHTNLKQLIDAKQARFGNKSLRMPSDRVIDDPISG